LPISIRQQRETFKPIPERDAALIGYISSDWSLCEQQLVLIVGFALNLGSAATQALAADLGAIQRFTIIENLLRLAAAPDAVAEWIEIKREFDKLAPLRNQYIHAVWGLSGSDLRLERHNAKNGVRLVAGTVKREDLESVWDRVTALSIRLARFHRLLHRANVPQILSGDSPPGLLPEHVLSPRAP